MSLTKFKSYRKSDKTLIEFFKKPVFLTAFLQRLNYCLITLFRQGLSIHLIAEFGL